MNNDYLDARTPEERAADAKIKGVTTTSTPIPMNNESKCCERCACKEPRTHAPYWNTCHNPSCPCHTPAPAMSEVMKKVDEQVGDAVRRLGEEHAPEDWEKEFDVNFPNPQLSIQYEFNEPYFLDMARVKDFIKKLIASREAAARREGAERAVEYIRNHGVANAFKSGYVPPEYAGRDWYVINSEQLDAARSEGVNG